MKYISKKPPHLFMDGAYYFLTNRSVDRKPYFEKADHCQLFLNVLETALRKFSVTCQGYILLPNHYHLICRFAKVDFLPKFMNNLHANSARLINKLGHCAGRKIWFNYWDHCIRNEREFFYTLNYIHLNPLKHGLIDDIRQLPDFPYSSLPAYIRKFGRETVMEWFRQHPISQIGDKLFSGLKDF